jgi:hypothetical protein
MLRQAQHSAYPPALPTLRQAQGRHGKGAERVMAVVIFHGKATFVLEGIGSLPVRGGLGWGF